MGPTEDQLRTIDLRDRVGLRNLPVAMLDQLEEAGHARHGFCQKCWDAAYLREKDEPMRDQADHYVDILREVEA